MGKQERLSPIAGDLEGPRLAISYHRQSGLSRSYFIPLQMEPKETLFRFYGCFPVTIAHGEPRGLAALEAQSDQQDKHPVSHNTKPLGLQQVGGDCVLNAASVFPNGFPNTSLLGNSPLILLLPGARGGEGGQACGNLLTTCTPAVLRLSA